MPIDQYSSGGGGSGGSGDVTGPASSTDNALARYNGTTGKILQNSDATLSDSGDMTVTGEVTSNFLPLRKFALQNSSTGLFEGGVPSINADPTLFDVSAGSGQIVDNWTDPLNPTIAQVTWGAFTGVTPTFIATQGTSFLYINSAGAIEQSTSFPNDGDLRDKIQIGSLVHPDNVNITGTSSFVQAPIQNAAQTLTDFTIAIGVINESGNVIFGTTGTLQFEKTTGVSAYAGINYRTNKKDPNRKQVPAKLATDQFIVVWRDGVGGYNTKLTTVIEPQFYDDGTGGASNPTGSVNINNWQVMYIQYSPDAEIAVVQWGQTEYGTQNAALNAVARGTDVFEGDPEFAGVPVRAYLIVRGGASDLSDSGDATFIDAGKFGASVGQASTSDAAITLQTAYENSGTPEIITNVSNGCVEYQQGSGSDADDVFCVNNGAGTNTFGVTGAGDITANSFTGDGSGLTNLPSSTPFEDSFVATGGQTNFTLSQTPSAAWVWINGAAQDASTWSISGDDVVLSTPATVGDVVETYALSLVGVTPPAAGGGVMEVVETQVISGSPTNVEFTTGIDSTYESYVFVFNGVACTDDVRNLQMRVSTDGGSSFDTTNGNYGWAGVETTTAGISTVRQNVSASFVEVSFQNEAIDTGHGMSGEIKMFNPSNTDFYTIFRSSLGHLKSTAIVSRDGTSMYKQLTAMNGVRFYWQTGTFQNQGSITLYGVKTS